MVFDYFPGCSLKTKAKDFDIYARQAARILNIDLEELPEWQCCGAVYPLAKDEIATRLSSVRALAAARERQRDLLTLCSACHHVLKRVNYDMRHQIDIRTKANDYLDMTVEYAGETKVIHYLEMLRDSVGFANLAKKVKRPLTGRRIGAYYGCLLLRPNKVMAFDNPENPSILEDFIRALGGQPVIYPYRNECCGGYITLEDGQLAQNKCRTILDSAFGQAVDTLITACPLCLYNLGKNAGQNNNSPVVVYFTQLLAQALGIDEED